MRPVLWTGAGAAGEALERAKQQLQIAKTEQEIANADRAIADAEEKSREQQRVKEVRQGGQF